MAAPAPVALPGNTQFDGWGSFNSTTMPGYGTYPGASPWSSGAIGSNVPSSGDALLNRVSGSGSSGPYVASSSIYFAGAGTLSVTDSTPVPAVKTVVLQVEMGLGLTNDFTAPPALTYNGGTPGPTPTRHQGAGGVGATDPDGNPATTTTLLYQWDLTGVSNVTSFGVEWSNSQHTQIYAVQLDQSDSFTAVPEPGAVGMIALSALPLLRRRRSQPAANPV